MDQALFLQLCQNFYRQNREKNGIGTLSEKTLHAILKQYMESNQDRHEVKIGRYVADIVVGQAITEIQTGNFNKLRKKLEFFLESFSVTVVYPIAKTKWLLWLDPETGSVSKRRKSPRKGTPYDSFFELYKIKQLLVHPNLKIHLVLFESEEYRYLNGWSQDRKKGSVRYDRIPIALEEEVCIDSNRDYLKLIPDTLGAEFTSKDFKEASKLSISGARTALNVLFYVGAVKRVGKYGNSYIYERNS